MKLGFKLRDENNTLTNNLKGKEIIKEAYLIEWRANNVANNTNETITCWSITNVKRTNKQGSEKLQNDNSESTRQILALEMINKFAKLQSN